MLFRSFDTTNDINSGIEALVATLGALDSAMNPFDDEAKLQNYDNDKDRKRLTYMKSRQFFEYVDALELYVDTLTSINKVLYNLTHNAGNIYDLTVEAIQRLKRYETGYKTKIFWKRMGFILGTQF